MRAPLHLVYVAEAPVTPRSGMGRVAWHWRQEAVRRGHRWTSLTPAELGPYRHPALFPLQALLALRRLANPPDLIVAHEPATSLFLRQRCPVIAHSHGLERRQWLLHCAGRQGQPPPGWKSRLLTPLWRIAPADRAIRRADLVCLPNQQDLRFAIESCGRSPSDCLVFRNGIDPLPPVGMREPGPAPSHHAKQQLTIGFLASWLPRKGIPTLLQAVRLLAASSPDPPRWLLAGTGVSEAAIRSQWPADLQDDLQVIPSFPADAELQILSQLDIYVLPSFFEGQPLTLLQAMAAGLPCVASDCCGQRDLIRHGVNGLLFPPGDAAQLAQRLQDCLASPERRRQLGQAARRSVSDRTWPVVSAEVIDRLELLVQNQPRRRSRSG